MGAENSFIYTHIVYSYFNYCSRVCKKSENALQTCVTATLGSNKASPNIQCGITDPSQANTDPESVDFSLSITVSK